MKIKKKIQKTMILLSAASILILILIAGCGQQSSPNTQNPPSNPPPVQNAKNEVLIKDFAFIPSTLTVKMLDTVVTVVWTNDDSVTHTIKSDSFNSGNLNKGDSFEFNFTATGEYEYSCGIHPSMKGKIIVTALPD